MSQATRNKLKIRVYKSSPVGAYDDLCATLRFAAAMGRAEQCCRQRSPTEAADRTACIVALCHAALGKPRR